MVGRDIGRWPAWRGRGTIRSSRQPHPLGAPTHEPDPGLTLVGLLLVLLSIPLALSLGPLVIGIVVLAFGVRRANDGLARPA